MNSFVYWGKHIPAITTVYLQSVASLFITLTYSANLCNFDNIHVLTIVKGPACISLYLGKRRAMTRALRPPDPSIGSFVLFWVHSSYLLAACVFVSIKCFQLNLCSHLCFNSFCLQLIMEGRGRQQLTCARHALH